MVGLEHVANKFSLFSGDSVERCVTYGHFQGSYVRVSALNCGLERVENYAKRLDQNDHGSFPSTEGWRQPFCHGDAVKRSGGVD